MTAPVAAFEAAAHRRAEEIEPLPLSEDSRSDSIAVHVT